MIPNLHLAISPGRFRFYFLSLFFLFASVSLYAQTVTGTVTDGEAKPVSGATVSVKGTNRATVTNAAGTFTINAARTEVLVISYVGFIEQEISINGRSSVSVSLVRGDGTIEEVVVTALGIKKEARKLGYSATTAKVDELQKNRTNNVMTGLEGKIAGLDISPPSAGPASSNKIRIRGQSGFNGTDNGPLLVINGLPISQGANSANAGGGADGGSRDGGDNLLMVNPGRYRK
ncbi:MAG: carboxypeptidase-like regulatory domain-containing protein, partial [Chitinophagaceae bacterium]